MESNRVEVMTKRILFSFVMAFAAFSTASAKVGYTARNGHTVEIDGLSTQCDPGAGIADFHGKVIKREFEDNQIILKGVVIEAEDGTRTYINVEMPEDLDMATRSWIVLGLQTLLREGRFVRGTMRLCGAAGRMQNLDSLR
jgi:hypothetical protein